MDGDLASAAAALENAGWRSTLVRGALRQATFFRVGTVLPAVRNHTLRYVQGPQPWSTDTPKAPIHLLLAGPGGLALLLGHRWNRTRPTTIYQHLGPGRGYTPAFTVNA